MNGFLPRRFAAELINDGVGDSGKLFGHFKRWPESKEKSHDVLGTRIILRSTGFCRAARGLLRKSKSRMKTMHFGLWPGANRSNSHNYCKDEQQHQRPKGAFTGSGICAADHYWSGEKIFEVRSP